jgi:hypothetical protein
MIIAALKIYLYFNVVEKLHVNGVGDHARPQKIPSGNECRLLAWRGSPASET